MEVKFVGIVSVSYVDLKEKLTYQTNYNNVQLTLSKYNNCRTFYIFDILVSLKK